MSFAHVDGYYVGHGGKSRQPSADFGREVGIYDRVRLVVDIS